ncbi:hypothetical protein MtrunA17_Chr2g0294011 [Medicago truncatula]|uniref:RNase H type-1 domain-containing protein n=1 Tax=Medicago truncatula TaxID=3880 RepID=A0A072VG38_MEDTR|nr:hypothetical protein MTR_2g033485 [Medicago truncatula]RHN73022.1 hypothetical protein MtrunA17_Chr2g0294011 [Medicago truncatula]
MEHLWETLAKPVLEFSETLKTELCGAMRAIGVASQKQWNFLWLETDSMLVVQAFKSSILVPWQVRNRWNNVQRY